jgi:hypothetical protein
MTCCHCGGGLVAERTGAGIRVPFGAEPPFVLAARCPYPRCACIVCARAPDVRAGEPLGFELTTAAEAARWSPRAVASAASSWLWLCALIVAFAAIPAVGLREAYESLSCGGIAWFFFLGGSLLALVPVIYFVRALACGANDALRSAARARAAVHAGETGGLRLVPDARTYRSH